MTSTPMHHPDDDTRPVPEDQGTAHHDEHGTGDPVDEETKRLSEDEAAQHDGPAEAQDTDAAESGGYGH